MAAFVAFLSRLLNEGADVLSGPPEIEPSSERGAATELLAAAYADYRLDVAGPPIPFDAETALAAAERVWWACWFLVHHGEPPEVLEKALAMPAAPTTAPQHLSADLVLRFLPQVHRRAKAVDAADVLHGLLARLLRQWPLSGVRADVEEGPSVRVELDGHPGLLLLYAERLADHYKPAWVPADGPAREYVEMVLRKDEG